MTNIQDKINGNAGKYTLGTLGLIASPKILQNTFKEAGLKGTLKENIDTFIKSNGGIMGAVNETIEEAVNGKMSLFRKMSKNKYAKIALLATFPVIMTLAGIATGHSIDKANKKANNNK